MALDYNGICLIEDTRQQEHKHDIKNTWFAEKGIKLLRSKLPFGDYALLHDTTLVVDTKKDFMELEGNLTKDHVRFRNEITNANAYGIDVVILIEEDKKYLNLDEFAMFYKIPRWKSTTDKHKRGQPMAYFNVETIVKAMKTMQQKYRVVFEFTTKEECPKRIIQILTEERENYKNMMKKEVDING